mmetsp:Transcript_42472/g.70635  ORF Transcript_42472/g.70635 Transcript_42472/m.70635 type:complete len:239 (-) Transcript_42472:311-1027(-)
MRVTSRLRRTAMVAMRSPGHRLHTKSSTVEARHQLTAFVFAITMNGAQPRTNSLAIAALASLRDGTDVRNGGIARGEGRAILRVNHLAQDLELGIFDDFFSDFAFKVERFIGQNFLEDLEACLYSRGQHTHLDHSALCCGLVQQRLNRAAVDVVIVSISIRTGIVSKAYRSKGLSLHRPRLEESTILKTRSRCHLANGPATCGRLKGEAAITDLVQQVLMELGTRALCLDQHGVIHRK